MKIDLGFTDYMDPLEMFRCSFLKTMESDALCVEEHFTLKMSLKDFLDQLRQIVEKADPLCKVEHMHGVKHNGYYITINDEHSKPAMLVQIEWDGDGDIYTATESVFQVFLTGMPHLVQASLKDLRATFPERLPRIRWWFMAGENLTSHNVVLRKPSSVEPEYYPFMDGDPMQYMRDYLDHSAAVLFLSGPAGTGKTTLLRNFLYTNRLRAVVTYEDTLLNSDQMFVDFVTSSHHDVMIIEDADVMLGSREHSGNKMIARFLNASDGIIQLHHKKIIFTTNLNNFNEVDDALLRPGRSYGAVMFRALNPDEADAAARVAEIKDWKHPDRDLTLAEIFNPPNKTNFGKRAVGFIS